MANHPRSAIPNIAAVVGHLPVDVMNFGQYVVFANGMNWLPRPVIQGYSAYTPYLQTLNGEFMRTRPERSFVMYEHATIDDRFPTLDDSAAFRQLLSSYVPRLREQDILLLEKAAPRRSELQPILDRKLSFGESLALPDTAEGLLFASIRMTRTVTGRLSTILFQEFPLEIRVETASAGKTYRFVPSMGELPFLLSPLIESNDDLLDVYAGRGTRVSRVSFAAPKGFGGQYHDTFTVRLYTSFRPITR